MSFSEEVGALFGQYKDNIKVIKDDSTLELFTFILKNPNNQVRATSINKVQIGKFYIIKYNFNGNKLWCPILTIPPVPNKNEKGVILNQLKIVKTKGIIYAVNFDYLPLRYKAALIETVIQNNFERYEKNEDTISMGGNVKSEFNFKVNWIYDFLKNNGNKNYAITAYDILKIENVFEISSTILHRFVFLDTYYINNRLMYDTLNMIQDEIIKGDFSDKIKMFEEILKMYHTDIEEFYKSLRSFEKNLKLIDNLP
jgi:hypothetical protein